MTNRGHGRSQAAARVAAVAALLLSVLLGAAGPALAQESAAGESIRSYEVELVVRDDGDLYVTETIVYDFGPHTRHGIYRDIPVRFRYDDRHDRVYPLDVEEVVGSPGTPDDVEISEEGQLVRIRIGDPDRTIRGVHTYTIRYRVSGALNAFGDHDELYWNPIGHSFEVPIREARATVSMPGPITDVRCFLGEQGSERSCERADKQDASATFATSGLPAYAGMTVVVAIPKGVVPAPEPILDERWSLQRAFALTPVTGGGALVLLAGLLSLVWRVAQRGRDRRFAGSDVDMIFGDTGDAEQPVPLLHRPPRPVQFAPPKGLRPGQVGTLVDERAHQVDVTATIVDLAVRGYLRIEEVPKRGMLGSTDWRLVRLRDPEGLARYEVLLFNALFGRRRSGEVLLSKLKNEFSKRYERVQDALYEDVVAQGWFEERPDRVRSRWLGGAVFAVIASVGVLVVAAVLTHVALLAVPPVIAAIAFAVVAPRMPRRTAKGRSVVEQVLGFRRFIVESEKERAAFAERAHLFTEYLPYAIVFGAVDKWAKAFAGLDAAVQAHTGWYVGSSPFSPHLFASSVGNFSSSAGTTLASTPSSSGSSGFSGGFSGGGGGGGGGGSW